MHHRSRVLVQVSLWLMLAAAANAQEPRTHIPGAPAATGASGSCMYGGDGKLLFAPKGAVCPERQQPPASLAETPLRAAPPAARPSAQRSDAPPATGNALPANLRAEAAALFEERERLDVELARVREAVAYEDREAARRVAEAALAKITQHLEREARLLREIAVSGAR
jgi:hypothetical protein